MPFIDIVFDGPPSHKSGRFVEVEDMQGRGVSAGEWVDHSLGRPYCALRIHYVPVAAIQTILDAVNDEPMSGPRREQVAVQGLKDLITGAR